MSTRKKRPRAAKLTLPIPTSYAPMEALLVDEIPDGSGEWQYEPKWDGFRCLAFRDGESIDLRSKAGQPLARYFPDVVATLRELPATRFVLDGEILVPIKGAPSFDDLLQRIHPAASRVNKLAAETPGIFIVFDLLVDDRGEALVDLPLRDRRARLEAFAKKYFRGAKRGDRIRLSSMTRDVDEARRWFKKLGTGLDGVIAKRLDLPYRSGLRDGMQKIKNIRTADCVVGGFRYAAKAPVIGSLLLGLYDDAGVLHHVGFTSSFKAEQRTSLKPTIERLRKPAAEGGGFTGQSPGGPSRWSTERSGQWEPLDPTLVVEVQYDHFTAGRFRHGTKLLRFRPDKSPRACTMDQVERGAKSSLKLLGA
jgi:ATP-dependent DNA ligase